jgi:hypothetical protein
MSSRRVSFGNRRTRLDSGQNPSSTASAIAARSSSGSVFLLFLIFNLAEEFLL